MRVFLIGYPGDLGGANTEAWHTIKLWRQSGLDVHLIPTWQADEKWKQRLDAIGCTTHSVRPEDLDWVDGLAGSPVVGMCNSEFMAQAHRFRAMECPIVWVNCMTFLFEHERKFFAEHGPADAMVFQSEFQRAELEPQLQKFGYEQASGHLLRGAFDVHDWTFKPRMHLPGETFVVGRMSRPDVDKWSSNTWQIYGRIQYRNKRALMLGMDASTHAKCGAPPDWADCLKPMAMPVQQYLESLHCLLPINGGARENWPRAGLEAMAAGVPVVAQNQWGWREMIEHGVTGFLGDCDEELAHYVALLAYDEDVRISMIEAASDRLRNHWANPEVFGNGWKRLFMTLTPDSKVVA